MMNSQMTSIKNKVAENQNLLVIDLEDFYPQEKITYLDISPWLFQGILLKEKDFRQAITTWNFEQYKNQIVILHCSTDAIVPAWAYLLVTSALQGFAKEVSFETEQQYIKSFYQNYIHQLDVVAYTDKIVMLKGCSTKEIPQIVYLQFLQKIQPYAKRISYGEACSSVPVYKK